MDYSRGRGSECSRPGYGTSPLGGGISPLGGGTINPFIDTLDLTEDWGNRLMNGTNKILYTPGPREKEAVIPQETNPDLPGSVQESLAEVWGH